MSKGRKDDLTVPLSCRHPFGLAFVLGVSLGVSCWAVRSPSLVVREQGLVVPVEMLPLLRSTESLPLITAMLQFLSPFVKRRAPGLSLICEGGSRTGRAAEPSTEKAGAPRSRAGEGVSDRHTRACKGLGLLCLLWDRTQEFFSYLTPWGKVLIMVTAGIQRDLI